MIAFRARSPRIQSSAPVIWHQAMVFSRQKAPASLPNGAALPHLRRENLSIVAAKAAMLSPGGAARFGGLNIQNWPAMQVTSH
jgi:hypothetical protein